MLRGLLMKMFRRALIAVVMCAAGATQVVAQGQGATLVLEVPVVAIESRYWVYVDRRLVESSSGGSNFTFVRSEGPDDPFVAMDSRGVAVRGRADGEVLFIRAGVERTSVFRQVRVDVPPGRHRVELATAPIPEAIPLFPFAVRGTEVSVSAGEVRTVGLRLGAHPRPRWPPEHGNVTEDPLGWVEKQVSAADTILASYYADPVGRALEDARSDLRRSPPSDPVVLVRLPQERGGARELDSNQVRSIVQWLRSTHWQFWLNEPAWYVNDADASRLFSDLLQVVRREVYDRQARFNEIAATLERVRR